MFLAKLGGRLSCIEILALLYINALQIYGKVACGYNCKIYCIRVPSRIYILLDHPFMNCHCVSCTKKAVAVQV